MRVTQDVSGPPGFSHPGSRAERCGGRPAGGAAEADRIADEICRATQKQAKY
jgi:hypothetical protein